VVSDLNGLTGPVVWVAVTVTVLLYGATVEYLPDGVGTVFQIKIVDIGSFASARSIRFERFKLFNPYAVVTGGDDSSL
jgi:hypothetical protein